jgi:DNA-binding MarR family transcriptional regulator
MANVRHSEVSLADKCAVIESFCQCLPGTTTLNELRIIAEIVTKTALGEEIGVTSLSKSLGMPLSTISTHVTDMISKGWIGEEINPEDRRKRFLTMSVPGRDDVLREFGVPL